MATQKTDLSVTTRKSGRSLGPRSFLSGQPHEELTAGPLRVSPVLLSQHRTVRTPHAKAQVVHTGGGTGGGHSGAKTPPLTDHTLCKCSGQCRRGLSWDARDQPLLGGWGRGWGGLRKPGNRPGF